MTLVGLIVLSMVATVFAWVFLEPSFRTPRWMRQNYRGHWLPTAGGIVVVFVAVLAEIGLAVGGADRGEQRHYILGAALGFALLGLLDDVRGGSAITGYRGHLRALARGEVTTGAVKLLGGGLIGLAVAMKHTSGDGFGIIVDAGVIALVANLANLLDRSPGRSAKVTLFAGVVLIVATGAPPELAGTAVVVGVGLGLLPGDLRERLMLGDTGANALGAAVGTGIVIGTSESVRVAVFVIALALNMASEYVSFSEVIRRNAVLRGLDNLGRRYRPSGAETTEPAPSGGSAS